LLQYHYSIDKAPYLHIPSPIRAVHLHPGIRAKKADSQLRGIVGVKYRPQE